MSILPNKSVLIEGDKSQFASKSAIERFKKDLRMNNIEKLQMNDYFKQDYTYETVLTNEKEIKVRIISKPVNKPVTQNEKRKLLKDCLKAMRDSRQSASNVKSAMKSKVPEDLLHAYFDLKKYKISQPIPSPVEVLENQEEFKPIIMQIIQSFGMMVGNNNPVLNYFKLLAKHVGLDTTQIQQQLEQLQQQQQQQQQQPQSNQANDFIKQLREERGNNITEEVDEEMSKIYESLGISNKKEETNN
jgi:hypothetical protein